MTIKLQQCLPFTVLKLVDLYFNFNRAIRLLQQCLPFTVLKLGLETVQTHMSMVATVLTVYGIETYGRMLRPEKFVLLQQCLPFTVLKPKTFNLVREIPNSCNSAYRLRY